MSLRAAAPAVGFERQEEERKGAARGDEEERVSLFCFLTANSGAYADSHLSEWTRW